MTVAYPLSCSDAFPRAASRETAPAALEPEETSRS